MPQDQKTKQAFEHTAKMHHEEREEAKANDETNTAALRGDSHTGQEGMLRYADKPLLEGTEIKELRDMFPDWHKDQLRRLMIVPQGTRLQQGDVFCDLRFRERGELVAHGEEEVHDEWLVPKHSVDYEIWNKLLGKPTASE